MKKGIVLILAAMLLAAPKVSFADSAVGDVIVTLGENLTAGQKDALLKEMNAPQDAQMVTVSNAEEHKYLGKYVPASQIGTKALSSSSIKIENKGSGLEVKTNNINWVTDEMYLNALMTAGVKDATVYVTAPTQVSGTAALTGLMKAYEVSSDKAIPEDVKQVANQELVTTAKLGEEHGQENAAALLAKIKEEVAKNGLPKDDAELKQMIEKAAKDLNITLSEADIQKLIDLFHSMQNANIDWNQVGQQLDQAKDKITKYIQSDEGQSFLKKAQDFFAALWNAIVSLFSGK